MTGELYFGILFFVETKRSHNSTTTQGKIKVKKKTLNSDLIQIIGAGCLLLDELKEFEATCLAHYKKFGDEAMRYTDETIDATKKMRRTVETAIAEALSYKTYINSK